MSRPAAAELLADLRDVRAVRSPVGSVSRRSAELLADLRDVRALLREVGAALDESDLLPAFERALADVRRRPDR